ncbi:hypothetical protein OXPF_00320 [Oxobacter pfennigii]|uniref:Uncharacterized protein n=1 Tax=Oxobacter pfennigii TaxID=36849 RepID=A0A0N8NU14_9CLOT|nr:hypothetical protein [Oxobacter pfennigii]KPU46360.1 hypothetical protein OXPF_00320 [Oxobacter pfennigii]
MKIVHEEYGDSLNRLTIRYIKTYDYKSMENLKEIIKILSNGDKFYFQFAREDYFLEDNELLEYRNQVPQYLKQNGFYEVKYKLDETRFDSIGLSFIRHIRSISACQRSRLSRHHAFTRL